MKLKLALLIAILIASSANAYTYSSDGDRYRVTCDNGFFVGWARVNGSGFWSSQDVPTTIDKDRDVVMRAMVRAKGGSCT